MFPGCCIIRSQRPINASQHELFIAFVRLGAPLHHHDRQGGCDDACTRETVFCCIDIHLLTKEGGLPCVGYARVLSAKMYYHAQDMRYLAQHTAIVTHAAIITTITITTIIIITITTTTITIIITTSTP